MARMKIKLAVDRTQNRVLFADAGSNLVDILLGFLTLPLSAVYPITGLSSPGCLTGLRDSVNHLRNSDLLKPDACHGMLLMPTSCKSPCKECSHGLAGLLHVYTEVWNTGGFVRGKERFMISDDLEIKPASTSSLLSSLPQMFGSESDGIGHSFEEMEVSVGWAEVVSMLEASLSSDTIFTDVFLSKGATVMKPSIHQKILSRQSDKDSGSSPESKIRIFYDTHANQIMYAECDHGFVDLLLGFLTYPVGCVMKNIGTCHLGTSLGNLYSSAVDLDAAGFLAGRFPRNTLLDPSLTPFNPETSMCRPLSCRCESTWGCDETCHICHPQLVEDRKYIVEDDLLIHQASAISMMKLWGGRDKTKVMGLEMTIEKQEALALMQAVFSSKMALTDVFRRSLEERSKVMQIFVQIRTGQTITVDVMSSDTIATLKSRINEKVPAPENCRFALLYASRYLKDSCTVDEYGIRRASTIILQLLVPPSFAPHSW